MTVTNRGRALTVAQDARKLAEWFVKNEKTPTTIHIAQRDVNVLKEYRDDPEVRSLRSYLVDHDIKVKAIQ